DRKWSSCIAVTGSARGQNCAASVGPGSQCENSSRLAGGYSLASGRNSNDACGICREAYRQPACTCRLIESDGSIEASIDRKQGAVRRDRHRQWADHHGGIGSWKTWNGSGDIGASGIGAGGDLEGRALGSGQDGDACWNGCNSGVGAG